MPPHVVAAAAAVAAAIALVGWVVATGGNPARARVLGNLTSGYTGAADSGRTSRRSPFAWVAAAITPASISRRLERNLVLAGRPAAWPLAKLQMAKLVLFCVGGALGLLFVLDAPSAGRLLMAATVTVVAYFTPDLLLLSRGQERQTAIGLELADTLDQMTIAVAAGLGFESAMMRAGHTGKGPLAEELVRTLQDMQVGRSRREAYLALAGRTTVADLRRFVRAVIQADAYGIAITDVLRTQASEMRLKRRQRAEEKAMQIPVKVIFPLILCILPTLFIVLLGPAAMDVVAAFSDNGL